MSFGARIVQSLGVYGDRRMLTLLALGFSSGLPVPLVFSNLSIWLRDSDVSRTDIGLFALATIPYAVNFLWAPLVDRLRLPFFTQRFGRRRGWALFTQLWLIVALFVLSGTNPAVNVQAVALAVVFVAFISATQDIVIDAYRIDVLEPEQYGAGAAVAVWGWHIGGTLIGGAGGLYLAHYFDWNTAYFLLSGCVLIGMVAILMSPEPTRRPSDDTLGLEAKGQAFIARTGAKGALAEALTWLHVAAAAPLLEFMRRRGWLLIIAFIVFFKFGDALLGRMSGVFYRELGFELDTIAEVMKVYGLLANAFGILLGGWLVARVGLLRSLFVAGVLAAVTNLAYSWLAASGNNQVVFTIAVVSDNITGGMATVAFVAYLSSLCNVAYTATQYALLASVSNLARISLSASSGWMVDRLEGDWFVFFLLTAAIALAALPLLLVLMRRYPDHTVRESQAK